jgi:hypothetical protein
LRIVRDLLRHLMMKVRLERKSFGAVREAEARVTGARR